MLLSDADLSVILISRKLNKYNKSTYESKMADPKGIKEKLLSTSVVGWQVAFSCVALFSACTVSVAAFGYLIYSTAELECHSVFFYLALLWLASEYAVIGWLYSDRNIPKFARDSVIITILLANVWFILFVFGLTECAL